MLAGRKCDSIEYCLLAACSEFLDSGPLRRLWEKDFIPGVVSDGWLDARESDRRIACPVDVNRVSISREQMAEPVNDQCIETEQTRLNAKYWVVAASASGFQHPGVLVFRHKLTSIIPAADERFDKACDAHSNPGAGNHSCR